MMYDVSKLNLDSLKGYNMSIDVNGENDLLEPTFDYLPAPTFVEDGILYLNCETEVFVGDYYNEFGIEILDRVVDWAEANGGYWEWVNPGCLMFCK